MRVGVHPIIENRSDSTGGMSMKELFSRNIDFAGRDHVQSFLEELRYKARTDVEEGEGEEEDNVFCYDEEEDCTTIVGTGLHGPTFDPDYDEESKEVSQAQLEHSNLASKLIYCSAQACQCCMAPRESFKHSMDERSHPQGVRSLIFPIECGLTSNYRSIGQ